MMRNLLIVLSILMLCSSCHQDDEDLQPPAAEKKSLYELMIVFAPGQLGDRGYADNVFNGVTYLIQYNATATDSTSVDADFISRYDYTSTRKAMENWVVNPVNPVNEQEYQRRLLVLTEPFMLNWLSTCKDSLRPTDEVLVLKLIEEDVNAANDTLELGNRLHAVNISMAEPIRMYCDRVRSEISYNYRLAEGFIPFNDTSFPVFRLYSEDLTPSRDSVYETLVEELGKDINILKTNFYTRSPEGYPQSLYGLSTMEQRMSFTLQAFMQMIRNGMYFPIIGLGTMNAGIDYFLLDESREKFDYSFRPFFLDAGPSLVNRSYILRPFDRVLADWVGRWLNSESCAMPAAEVHGHWDGFPCITDMFFLNDDDDDDDDDDGDWADSDRDHDGVDDEDDEWH